MFKIWINITFQLENGYTFQLHQVFTDHLCQVFYDEITLLLYAGSVLFELGSNHYLGVLKYLDTIVGIYIIMHNSNLCMHNQPDLKVNRETLD